MELEEKQALLLSALARTADQLGDVTPHVMQRYYARFPDAPAIFEQLHPGGRANLEGQMVEQVLFCLMQWFESPSEVEIVLITTIPHHLDTLGVRPVLFFQLVETAFDTIESTLPQAAKGERAVVDELRQTIGALVERELEFAANWHERQKEVPASQRG